MSIEKTTEILSQILDTPCGIYRVCQCGAIQYTSTSSEMKGNMMDNYNNEGIRASPCEICENPVVLQAPHNEEDFETNLEELGIPGGNSNQKLSANGWRGRKTYRKHC